MFVWACIMYDNDGEKYLLGIFSDRAKAIEQATIWINDTYPEAKETKRPTWEDQITIYYDNDCIANIVRYTMDKILK